MKVNYNEIENYSYTKYIFELKKLCHIHKIDIKIIGYKDFKEIGQRYPIYRIIVNPKAKNKICITAGVHGHEIAGPLCMLEIFSNPKKYFNRKISYQIYPCINPTSFDLRQRMNSDGVDLNELTKLSLHGKKYSEVKAFYDDIKYWPMDIFLTLHEDVDLNEFYAYVFENKPEPIYRKIIERWRTSFNGILNKKTIYGDKVIDGLIINIHDKSFEDHLYSNKMTRIAICTETPGLLPLENRIRMNIDNIKILSDYLIK